MFPLKKLWSTLNWINDVSWLIPVSSIAPVNSLYCKCKYSSLPAPSLSMSAGKDFWSLLLSRYNSFRLLRLSQKADVMLPVSWFCPRSRNHKSDKHSKLGRGPVNWLLRIDRYSRSSSPLILTGMVEVRALLSKSRYMRLLRLVTSLGMELPMSLFSRSKCSRCASLPIHFGRYPLSLLSSSSIFKTFPSVSHSLIPYQDLSTGQSFTQMSPVSVTGHVQPGWLGSVKPSHSWKGVSQLSLFVHPTLSVA